MMNFQGNDNNLCWLLPAKQLFTKLYTEINKLTNPFNQHPFNQQKPLIFIYITSRAHVFIYYIIHLKKKMLIFINYVPNFTLK